jgi:hypothetical protein
MANEIGKEVPGFAEIQDMHANRPDDFTSTVKRLVSLRGRATETQKDVTNTVNILGQGKLVSLALQDYTAAVRLKTTTSDFDDYFHSRFGGKVPGAGLTLARAFSAHCLAPITSARYVPESVFDGHYCRVLQTAGKVANRAWYIKGPTPETSFLNHQVFTDVGTVLKTGGKNALKDLRNIDARLVEVETTDGEDRMTTLVYLSAEALANRREIGVA